MDCFGPNELHLDHLLKIRQNTGKNILETIHHNPIKMIKLFIETSYIHPFPPSKRLSSPGEFQ